jgi:thiosulfate/3-mercaptopyruvate sulfurtransferase
LWTDNVPESELGRLLASTGIGLDKTIVVYGAGADDSAAMAQRLRGLGCQEVRTYDAGIAAWAADPTRPLARLANYEKLVYPGWVSRLVRGEQPATYPGRGFLVLEVGSGGRR